MMRRLYILAGRLVSPVAVLFLRSYTWATGRPRVRVVAVNEDGEVLLLKGILSIGDRWSFPGGGVNRGEELVCAAQREFYEETGIKKPLDAFRLVRHIEKTELNLGFTAALYVLSCKRDDLPDRLYNPREIAEIGWFAPHALPESVSQLVYVTVGQINKGDIVIK